MAADPEKKPEKDALFYDKNGHVWPDIVKKMKAATREIKIPENFYGFHHRYIPLEKDKLLGLLMKRDTVISVQSNGSFQGYLQSGDIITHIDKKLVPQDHSAIFKMITSRIPGKVHISLARFKCRVVNLPKAGKYPVDPGCTYEYKMLYLLRGMKLGLDTRDALERCIVAAILPNSIAAMGLTAGENIVEIETTPIQTVADCRANLEAKLTKQGYVRVCVGVPCNDYTRNLIRATINALFPSTSFPLNFEQPKEIRAMVEIGIKALKNIKAEPKSIVKQVSVLKQKARTNPHIAFDNVVNWYGIIPEVNTRYMVKVPPMRGTTSKEPEATQNEQQSTQESTTEHAATEQTREEKPKKTAPKKKGK